MLDATRDNSFWDKIFLPLCYHDDDDNDDDDDDDDDRW